MNNKTKLMITSLASVGLLIGAGVPALAVGHKGYPKTKPSTLASHTASEKQQTKQSKIASKLDRAVENGKITADQKTQILAKLDELHGFRETLKDLPHAERKQAVDAKRDEIKQWASDNGFPMGMFLLRHK